MRSQLRIAPGAPEALATALSHGADAVVVDLADGVADDRREVVRKSVSEWLRTVPASACVWVRITAGPQGHDDVREVAGPQLRGVCVARVERAVQIDALDALLSTVEDAAGLPRRCMAVIPALESAAAVASAMELARAPRVVRLQLGEAGLCAELGLEPSEDERELLLLRSQVVLACAAAGIAGPIASPAGDRPSVKALRESSLALRRLGFRGRECTEPAQVGVVNEVFSLAA